MISVAIRILGRTTGEACCICLLVIAVGVLIGINLIN